MFKKELRKIYKQKRKELTPKKINLFQKSIEAQIERLDFSENPLQTTAELHLTFIGAGNIAKAILGGYFEANPKASITATDAWD